LGHETFTKLGGAQKGLGTAGLNNLVS